MRKRPKKRKEAFTADEVRYLMENLPENKIGWSIRLLLCTGMRTQELLGLESMEDVRVLTPHCCRHTYVSQMQALGISVETIQSLVGHADMEMPRHYHHVQENMTGGCGTVQRNILQEG